MMSPYETSLSPLPDIGLSDVSTPEAVLPSLESHIEDLSCYVLPSRVSLSKRRWFHNSSTEDTPSCKARSFDVKCALLS